MNLISRKTALLAGCGYCLIASQALAQYSDQGSFSGSGQTPTLDCQSGKAAVAGSNNALAFTDHCTGLAVSGADNRIRIQLGEHAKISIAGSGNNISWEGKDSTAPEIRISGPGNQVTRQAN